MDSTTQSSAIQGAAGEVQKENTIQIHRGLLISQKQNLWFAKSNLSCLHYIKWFFSTAEHIYFGDLKAQRIKFLSNLFTAYKNLRLRILTSATFDFSFLNCQAKIFAEVATLQLFLHFVVTVKILFCILHFVTCLKHILTTSNHPQV